MATSLDLTEDLNALARLAGQDEGLEDLLRRGLDWLARVVDYDLATIFVLDGDHLEVKAARGPLAGPNVRGHTIDLASFPTIREALETRRARAYTEDDHAHGDGDPFDGVLDLPAGHSCMVVPLCAGDQRHGVLTLDRRRCEMFQPSVVNLVEIYGHLLAIALENADLRVRLSRRMAQAEDRARLYEVEALGDGDDPFAGSLSAAVTELARHARLVAQTDTPVLIRGETGTGKERLAHALHRWSRRRDQPFVRINCAALPEGLLEAELFGHVKGAFTGATRDRAGRFQMANGGTLLLDEIGELPIALQAKLLRVLQEGTLEPVGSDRTIKVDVRLLAATHVDLESAIADGRFREDLYYRLNVFPLALPPLRERRADIPGLGQALLSELARRTGRKAVRLTETAVQHLARYDWPGNVRELANVLERAIILSPDGILRPEVLTLPDSASSIPCAAPVMPTVAADGPVATLSEVQAAHIAQVLQLTEGRIYGAGGAAELLGLKPSTLQSRMKKLGVARRQG